MSNSNIIKVLFNHMYYGNWKHCRLAKFDILRVFVQPVTETVEATSICLEIIPNPPRICVQVIRRLLGEVEISQHTL